MKIALPSVSKETVKQALFWIGSATVCIAVTATLTTQTMCPSVDLIGEGVRGALGGSVTQRFQTTNPVVVKTIPPSTATPISPTPISTVTVIATQNNTPIRTTALGGAVAGDSTRIPASPTKNPAAKPVGYWQHRYMEQKGGIKDGCTQEGLCTDIKGNQFIPVEISVLLQIDKYYIEFSGWNSGFAYLPIQEVKDNIKAYEAEVKKWEEVVVQIQDALGNGTTQ